MANTEKTTYTISVPNYMDSISKGEDFFLQFYTLTPEAEGALIKLVHRYLENLDILYVREYVLLILMELIENAVKANIKRVFFKTRDLDINKSTDYRKGMEHFKEEAILANGEDYPEKLETSNLVVRVSFKNSQNFLHVSVINNTPILDLELRKVQGRIAKAFAYKEVAESFADVIDDSEGTGLGIIIAMMLLKSSGLKADAFKLYKKDNLTIATISIPKNLADPSEAEKIVDIVANELENLPFFPNNIVEIQALCRQKDVSIKAIAEAIGKDPGLTASMLRMANSAGYAGLSKVQNLEEAVMKIGIKSLNIILLASGMERIVQSKYKRFVTLWTEACKRAFYASTLATKFGKQKISDVSYLASLLSDVGRIVLLSLDSKALENLKNVESLKRLGNDDIVEEMSIGMSHATLGKLICQKWNFSEMLTTAIEFHNRPHLAPENLRDLVYIVYLADVFMKNEKATNLRFEFVDEDVLNFQINDSKTFEALHEELQEASEKQNIVKTYE